jgi:hypothetical protein
MTFEIDVNEIRDIIKKGLQASGNAIDRKLEAEINNLTVKMSVTKNAAENSIEWEIEAITGELNAVQVNDGVVRNGVEIDGDPFIDRALANIDIEKTFEGK